MYFGFDYNFCLITFPYNFSWWLLRAGSQVHPSSLDCSEDNVLPALEMYSMLSDAICFKLRLALWPPLFPYFLWLASYPSFICLSLIKCFSAKYDLILDEQAEDSKSSHAHTSKKHKKKTRHCSEEKEDEDYMPIKNPNQVFLIFRLKYGEISSLQFV